MVVFKFLLIIVFFSSATVTSLEPSTFSKELEANKNCVLLDVRMWDQYSTSRIPNSIWAGTKEVLDSLLLNIDTNVSVFVYCEKGFRSKDAILLLSSYKFERVYELKGGFSKWVEQKFPIDSIVIYKERVD